jgi:hypothetical protein
MAGYDMRGFWPINTQLWREMAHFDGIVRKVDDRPDLVCQRNLIDSPPSNRASIICQYRYPSPRRSGPLRARSTPLFARLFAQRAVDLCRPAQITQKTLVLQGETFDSAQIILTQNSMHKKGSNPCLNSVLFSPLRLSRRFRHVSTLILSAALSVQQAGQSSPMKSVLTRSSALPLAAQLAHFVTTSRASVAKAIALLFGTTNNFDRRSGFPPSGGFSF